MRIAVISDIHGNDLALEAVLADIDAQGIDEIVNLGDHLSGPLNAARTAEILIDRGTAAIQGNHDRYLVMTALLGILGYFGAIPGAANFTLYDRAKGAFQDPNVFGPFLVGPSLYLLHGLLTQPLSRAPLKVAGLLVLTLGVFLSFSRAAWALDLFCAVALVFVMR